MRYLIILVVGAIVFLTIWKIYTSAKLNSFLDGLSKKDTSADELDDIYEQTDRRVKAHEKNLTKAEKAVQAEKANLVKVKVKRGSTEQK